MADRPFRFGIVAGQASSGAEWLAKARRAESLGYATFLIPDTLGQTLAPLPALAAVAAATSTIRLGTYVLANDYRNPVLVARECATLDLLSGGRLELGLGAGRPGAEEDHRMLGIPFESGGVRVARLAESIGIIKALLSGERAEGGGAHYPIAGAHNFPPPAQRPRPPILVAASGSKLLALAAREADSVALAIVPSAGAAEYRDKIAQLRRAAPERFEQIELNVNLIAAGQTVPPWLIAQMGLDMAQLARSDSPAVLLGSADQMYERLLERREALGISYITVADYAMEALAPVVERLAGR